MRNEAQMLSLIVGVANSDPRIRAVYLTGSRANPKAAADIYQDYDVVYVVSDINSFLADDNWVHIFGEISLLQEPYLVDAAFGKVMDCSRMYAWLMLFKDGVRLDLTLLTLEEMEKGFRQDSLIKPLLDKDGKLPKIPPSSDKSYWIAKPVFQKYWACCNEFWWCMNTVGKGIARDEAGYTMWMLHQVCGKMLHTMVDWYIGLQYGFCVSSGKAGRYYKKLLPEELYKTYLLVYCSWSEQAVWTAVFAACRLFSHAAVAVAQHFNYSYNEQEEKNLLEYLGWIQEQTQGSTP